MKKCLYNLFEKCHSCSILGALICISGILIGISIATLTYSFFQKSDIDSAKKELEEIKKEYQLTLNNLKKIQDFSPEDYDAINTTAFMHASEAIGFFKNLYIATAIIATKVGDRDEALFAWRQATYINPDNRLCNYGLGMEYFKSATDPTNAENKSIQKKYLEQSIRYLSHKTLSDHPQALYHLALSKLRYIDSQSEASKKYDLAKKSVIILKNIDESKHPLGNVARNLAYAYCLAAKYSPDKSLAQEYRNQANLYLNEIHGLTEFDSFYEKYHNGCIKSAN